MHRFTSRSLRRDCRSPKILFPSVILFAPQFRLNVYDGLIDKLKIENNYEN